MKKYLCFFLAGITLFTLSGCGDGDINEVKLEELADGYSLQLADVLEEGEIVSVQSSEVETQGKRYPQTYIYKFCGDRERTPNVEVQRDISNDGVYYQYYTDGDFTGEQGGFWVDETTLNLASYPWSIYTDSSTLRRGPIYVTDGDYNITVEKIETITCDDI